MEWANKETLLKSAVKPQLALLGVISFTAMQCVCYKSQGSSKSSLLGENSSLGPTGQLQQGVMGGPAEEAAALHKGSFFSLSNCPVALRKCGYLRRWEHGLCYICTNAFQGNWWLKKPEERVFSLFRNNPKITTVAGQTNFFSISHERSNYNFSWWNRSAGK